MNIWRMVFLAAMMFFAACSSAPPPEKKEVEPPKPVTGLSAIYKAYGLARTWAPDAEFLKAQSINLQSVPSEGGKAGAWNIVFVSASLGKARPYTVSVVEDEGLHEGVFAQHEQSWSGPTSQSMPFRMAALKTDSDKAWTIAEEKSKEFIRKNPDMRVFFLVEQTDRFPNPTWRVIWGESITKSGHSVFIDVPLGNFLQVAH